MEMTGQLLPKSGICRPEADSGARDMVDVIPPDDKEPGGIVCGSLNKDNSITCNITGQRCRPSFGRFDLVKILP